MIPFDDRPNDAPFNNFLYVQYVSKNRGSFFCVHVNWNDGISKYLLNNNYVERKRGCSSYTTAFNFPESFHFMWLLVVRIPHPTYPGYVRIKCVFVRCIILYLRWLSKRIDEKPFEDFLCYHFTYFWFLENIKER